MKNFFILILFLSTFTGCSVFRIPFFSNTNKVSKELNIPTPPKRNIDELESIKQNIAVITDISNIAYTSGVNAQSYESKVLLDSSKVLQTISGLPTDPVNWEVKRDVKRLHESLLYQEKEYRRSKQDYENKIENLRNNKDVLKQENSRLSGLVSTLNFWFWALLILCFIFPTVGIPLCKFLIGRAIKTGKLAVEAASDGVKYQFSQVVDAIEEYKKEDPEHCKLLLDNLQKKTDSDTRKIINDIKNRK